MSVTKDYEDLMWKVTVIKDRVRGAIHGKSNGLYLHGRPGTSEPPSPAPP